MEVTLKLRIARGFFRDFIFIKMPQMIDFIFCVAYNVGEERRRLAEGEKNATQKDVPQYGNT